MNKPATPGGHHYFKGGLLYHIYCVTKNSYNIANMYEFPKAGIPYYKSLNPYYNI